MSEADETQAAAYRAMMRTRTRNKAARERALAAPIANRVELLADWQPMIDWQNERDNDGGGEIPETGQIFNVNPGVE